MTNTLEQQIADRLYILFRKKNAREHWLNTHNILLDGDCPADLVKTGEGMARVLAVLKEMVGA